VAPVRAAPAAAFTSLASGRDSKQALAPTSRPAPPTSPPWDRYALWGRALVAGRRWLTSRLSGNPERPCLDCGLLHATLTREDCPVRLHGEAVKAEWEAEEEARAREEAALADMFGSVSWSPSAAPTGRPTAIVPGAAGEAGRPSQLTRSKPPKVPLAVTPRSEANGRQDGADPGLTTTPQHRKERWLGVRCRMW